jgi:hypothetical protein
MENKASAISLQKRDEKGVIPSKPLHKNCPVWQLLAAALLIAIGMCRIALTYSVFSQTYDEPYHVACGMRWLQGSFAGCYEHPPLGRIAAALLPYLRGLRLTGKADVVEEGNAILNSGNDYARNLTLARLGILPFFVIASIFVWLWARKLFGEKTALLSLLLFTSLPPVLAHAGLATTDMAVTAVLFCALYAFTVWVRKPTAFHSLLFGISMGFAALSKFSTFIFLPTCILTLLVSLWVIEKPNLKRIRFALPSRMMTATFAVFVAALVVFAGYRFSSTHLSSPKFRPHHIVRMLGFAHLLGESSLPVRLINEAIEDTPVPSVGAIKEGLDITWHHNETGHDSYLLGESRRNGWWYFFVVLLLVKTPMAFLLLVAIGFPFLMKNRKKKVFWEQLAPLVCAITILAVCMPSKINLGIRHILVIYPLLAIIAAFGTASICRSPRRSYLAAAFVLLTWHSLSSGLAHPDYLAYFNELALGRPERIRVDSDLDWGQDLPRLRDEVKQLRINDLKIAYFGTADLDRFDLSRSGPKTTEWGTTLIGLTPFQATDGWIAISESSLRISGKILAREMRKSIGAFDWLEAYTPIARAGKSIRLYYIPKPHTATS